MTDQVSRRDTFPTLDGSSLFFPVGPAIAVVPGEDTNGSMDLRYPLGYVRRYGALGNGTTNDSPAVQRAVNSMNTLGLPQVTYDYGLYRQMQGIVIPKAVTIAGIGFPAGGLNAAANPFPTVLHDFNGPGYWFNGQGFSSGGGIERLRVVQVFGTPATTSGVGPCIKLAPADGGSRIAWLRIRDMNIEEWFGTNAPWTVALEVDSLGFANGVIDIFVNNIFSHVSSSVGAGHGAMRLNGVVGIKIADCEFSQNADFWCGDTDLTPTIAFSNVEGGILTLDKVSGCAWDGGILGKLVNSPNTIGVVDIKPSRLVDTAFTDLSSGATTILVYDPAAADGSTAGAMRSYQSVSVRNAAYFSSSKAAGGSKTLIGLDVNDVLRISANADSIGGFGAPPNFLNLAVGDFAFGRVARIPILDRPSTGAAPTAGILTLVGGTKVVATTAIAATDILTLTKKTNSGGAGADITYTINPGVGFTVNSSVGADASTFGWMIIRPS